MNTSDLLGVWRRGKQDLVRQRLQRAEDLVAEGEKHMLRQREILSHLERDGHDTSLATELLQVFEISQALHIADRDRLLDELSRLWGTTTELKA